MCFETSKPIWTPLEVPASGISRKGLASAMRMSLDAPGGLVCHFDGEDTVNV